jgi:hypothetical protein
MTDPRDLIAQLASEMARVPEAPNPVARLCAAASRVLGADGASVTLDNTSEKRITLCTTDAVAATLESAQEVTGEGPCIDAFVSDQPVTATIEQARDRWPMFMERATHVDVARFYALPMHTGSSVLGVMSLYQRSPAELAQEISDAAFLADALAVSVVGETERVQFTATDAWPDRREIHEATGMVIAQLGVREADALEILRARAFADTTDLVATARAVIARDLVFTRRGGQG